MRADEFYLPAVRDQLSQGDIVDFCPVGAVPALRVARIWQNETPPEAKATVYDYPLPSGAKRPPTPPLFKREPDTPLFEGRLRRCIVVSNDCVTIAKEGTRAQTLGMEPRKREWPWHVAPLQPWPLATQIVPLKDGDQPLGALIESGRIHRYLALPEAELVPRSYADFRFLTPLKPELFEQVKRIASLTDLGQAYLWAKTYTYFSGRALPAQLACPHCERTFSLADVKPLGVAEE